MESGLIYLGSNSKNTPRRPALIWTRLEERPSEAQKLWIGPGQIDPGGVAIHSVQRPESFFPTERRRDPVLISIPACYPRTGSLLCGVRKGTPL